VLENNKHCVPLALDASLGLALFRTDKEVIKRIEIGLRKGISILEAQYQQK
jgi:hypothetical protein